MTKIEIFNKANELAIKDTFKGLNKKENKEYTKLIEIIMVNDWEDEFYKM